MSYIRTVTLTPHEARTLKAIGFIVKLTELLCGNKDRYHVYAV